MLSKLVFFPPPSTYRKNNVIMIARLSIPSFSYLPTTEYVPLRYINIKSRNTILMCHGNAEDIGLVDIQKLARDWNSNICVFDYAGYGEHTVRVPSERDCYYDADAVYKWLLKQEDVIPNNIIIYGRSLGSGIACYLARNYKCKSLILISPLMSVMLTRLYVSLWGDMFKNYLLAPHIKCPTLIIHGTMDTVVPYQCGKDLAEYFPFAKFISLPGLGHNNIECPGYHNSIINFIS